jgi:hypothetical protein
LIRVTVYPGRGIEPPRNADETTSRLQDACLSLVVGPWGE